MIARGSSRLDYDATGAESNPDVRISGAPVLYDRFRLHFVPFAFQVSFQVNSHNLG
jgi:hypothetical protein